MKNTIIMSIIKMTAQTAIVIGVMSIIGLGVIESIKWKSPSVPNEESGLIWETQYKHQIRFVSREVFLIQKTLRISVIISFSLFFAGAIVNIFFNKTDK